MLQLFRDRPIISRLAAFVLICVVYASILGPLITTSTAFKSYDFTYYGSIGKALLFGALTLGVLAYKKKGNLTLLPFEFAQWFWAVLSVVSFAGAWVGFLHISNHQNLSIAISVHVLLWLSLLTAGVFVFGLANIKQLSRKLSREIRLSLLVTILFFGFLFAVYDLWRPLSYSVMYSVKFLMRIIGVHSQITSNMTLLFSKFSITISKYCSGIESIAFFTALYVLIGLTDWQKLIRKRYFALFFPGLVLLFAFNILRVFALILAGYYINPHIAFSLFHTYAGMVFFIVYSIVFWAFSYKFMLKPPTE